MTRDDEPTLETGTRLGKYAIVRPIGRGAMGVVYEARHLDLKKRVAIKALHASLAMDADIVGRFVREGRAATRIRDPHVVDVVDVGHIDGTAFMVMELLDGESLAACIAREGTLSLQRIADIMLPLCSALAKAHEARVIHRDVKPENVFLASARRGEIVPKLLDFGISKVAGDGAVSDRLTKSSGLLGTPMYMSPEQARGVRDIDGRTDQYALGAVMYECVTGRGPIEAASFYDAIDKILEGAFSPPSAHAMGLAPEFERVILRAMSLDREARYPSMVALGAVLVPFASARVRLIWADVFGPQEGDDLAFAKTVERNDVAAAPIAETNVAVDRTTLSSASREIVPLPERVRSRAPFGIASVVALAGLAVGGVWVSRGSTPPVRPAVRAPIETPHASPAPPPVPRYRVEVTVSPAIAQLAIDGVTLGVGRLSTEFARDGAPHMLVISAPRYEEERIAFADEAPPSKVELALLPEDEPHTETRIEPSHSRTSHGGRRAEPARNGAPTPPAAVTRTANGSPIVQ